MKSLRNIIGRNISGKKVLTLFLLTNVVYALMMIITIPKTMAHADGMKLFDMMPMGFDQAYAQSLLSALGETGRSVYLYNQIPLDLIYPLLFGFSYCLILAFFLKKINKLDSSLFYFCLLPLIAGSVDYLENAGIITMLVRYPDLSATLANTTSIFSVIKSMSTTLFFIVLIIVLIVLGIQSLKNRA